MVPSTTTCKYWLWVHSLVDNNYPNHTKKGGKWLIFVDKDSVDEVWSTVKEYTERGFLGKSSKVSTAKFGETKLVNSKDSFVICVYTYDSDDVDDVMDLREMLYTIGFKKKLRYKTDEATLNGNYAERGKSICKYVV